MSQSLAACLLLAAVESLVVCIPPNYSIQQHAANPQVLLDIPALRSLIINAASYLLQAGDMRATVTAVVLRPSACHELAAVFVVQTQGLASACRWQQCADCSANATAQL